MSLPERNSSEKLDSIIDEFAVAARKYDVVHIQHEHGLFIGDGDESDAVERFGSLLKILHKNNVKTMVTFHSDPVFYTPEVKFNAHGMLTWALSRMWRTQVARWFQPKYDMTAIVHTERTKQEFVDSTFHADNIQVVPHGVVERESKFRLIDPTKRVNMSIFGFISSYKGYNVAPVSYTHLRAHET